MYKITLYDQNCSPICDGTVFWFVEDLGEFEKNWLPLQSRHDVSTIERYYRSKFGEIVTDYYSDDPALNIVQQAGSEILQKKIYKYTNRIVELYNVYGYRTRIEFDSLLFTLLVLKYDTEYYLAGQYKGNGCRRISPIWNRWYKKETKYSQMNFFGNPVANYRCREISWDDWGSDDAYKDFYTDDKAFYQHEEIETFVWIPIKKVAEDYKIHALTKNEIAGFMRDIIGEAG